MSSRFLSSDTLGLKSVGTPTPLSKRELCFVFVLVWMMRRGGGAANTLKNWTIGKVLYKGLFILGTL